MEVEMSSVFVAVVLCLVFTVFSLLWRRTYVLGYLFCKKPLKSDWHGGEAVALVLKHHHVKHIFTLIGGHISPVLVAATKLGIQVIDTRHEATTVFAADAVARLTGIIGVAVVTAGPGVTNTITAVKNAQMAQSPVLLIGGAAPVLLKGRGALQDMDQLSLLKSICKYCASVATVRDIIPVIKKAIKVAMSGTPGPVFVELPIDILYPLHEVRKQVGASKGGSSLFSRIANWYLDWHVYNIFVDGFKKQDTSPLHVDEPRAKNSQVLGTLRLLSMSQKPVIIIGSQAMLPATCAPDLQKAIEYLGIPCFLSGMARGLLGKGHPLLLRHTRREVLNKADLTILAGAVCDFRLSYGKVLSKSAKIIAVNRSLKDLLMNSDIFWKPTLSIEGCVSDFIIRLAFEKSGKLLPFDRSWISSLHIRDNVKEEQNRKESDKIPELHLNPLKVLYSVDKALGDDTIIVADGGDFVGTASYIVRPRGPLKWLDPGPFGTLGVGAGFAIGAKVCNPAADVVILFGDGALGYSLMEFDTFFRHKLPILAVVGNDACWSQIERDQLRLFQNNVGCVLDYTDYHCAVEALGGQGILVKADDRNNLTAIFKHALCLLQTGSAVLVNALVSKSDFRKDSISV